MITADTVWDADTVRVTADVLVEDGVTLEVAAGTRVEFLDHYELGVQGRLLAVGTVSEPVVFTTDEPWLFRADSTAAGCWAGIRFDWTPASNPESLLEHCVLEYAKALGEEPWGGALSTTGFSEVLVRNTVIRRSIAERGGAAFFSHQSAPVLVGCLFEENAAFSYGSAVYSHYAYPTIAACTLVGNEILSDDVYDATGSVHNHIAKTRIAGSIVRENGNPYFEPTELHESKAYYTTDSNVEFWTGGFGTIDADAGFVGFGPHPYALLPGSPCRDTGPPDTTGLRLAAADLAGEPRIVDGRIDMGCYEGEAGTGVASPPVGSPRVACSPNPFSEEAGLSLRVPVAGRVVVRLYSVDGRLVRTLHDGHVEAGDMSLTWDGLDEGGRRAASGVYFARAMGPMPDIVGRLVLLR
ncbi:MAG: hypothetical protein GF405_08730 [Candidatus Eisenbacteria bacterium]|nr:hypothetical protein [Candidatus Eisenbacteria bacterium]